MDARRPGGRTGGSEGERERAETGGAGAGGLLRGVPTANDSAGGMEAGRPRVRLALGAWRLVLAGSCQG
jgi:hypothetical protein